MKAGKNSLFTAALILLILIQVFVCLNSAPGALYFLLLTLSVFIIFRMKNGNSVTRAVFSADGRAVYPGIKSSLFFLLLLLAGAFLAYKGIRKHGILTAWPHIIFVCTGMLGGLFLHRHKQAADEMCAKTIPAADIIIAVIIALFSFALRIYNLDEMPPGIYGEERLFIWKIIELHKNNFPYSVFVHDMAHQMGTPVYLLISFFMETFGYNHVNFRLGSVIAGTAAPAFFYLFLRIFFGRSVSLFGAIFFASEHIFLHLSRWTHIFQFTPLFLWSGLFFLAAGLKSGSARMMASAGLIAGWGLFFYQANKLIPLIFAIYLAKYYFLDCDYEKRRELLRGTIILMIAFLTASLPLICYIINNYGIYMAHINEVKVNTMKVLMMNISNYTGMFTVKGSDFPMQNFSGRPLLAIVPSVLFLIGIGRALPGIFKDKFFLPLLILVIGIIPGFFSTVQGGSPLTQRVIIAVSVMSVFVLIGTETLVAVLVKNFRIRVMVFAALTVLLTNLELKTYFHDMKHDNDTRLGFSALEFEFYREYLKYRDSCDVNSTNYFFKGDFLDRSFMGEEIYFGAINKGRFVYSPPKLLDINMNSVNSLLMFRYTGRDVVIFTESLRMNAYEMLKKRFPTAERQIIYGNYKERSKDLGLAPLMPDRYDPAVSMVIYRLKKEEIDNWQGLIYRAENGIVSRSALDGKGGITGPGGYFTGSIRVFEIGPHYFLFEGFDSPEIYIEGRKINLSGNYLILNNPVPGLVGIKIKTRRMTGKEKIISRTYKENKFIWKPALFVTEQSKQPVLVKYIADDGNKPEHIKSEFAVLPQFRWILGSVEERKMKAEIYFKLKIPENGRYSIETETGINGSVKIFLDGAVIIEKKAGDKDGVISGILPAGTHSINMLSGYEAGTWLNIRLRDNKTGETRNINEQDLSI